MAAERAGAVPVHPAVNAWLVELVLAGQLAKYVATLKVTQADLSGRQWDIVTTVRRSPSV